MGALRILLILQQYKNASGEEGYLSAETVRSAAPSAVKRTALQDSLCAFFDTTSSAEFELGSSEGLSL